MVYKVVHLPYGGYAVYGPLPAAWTPSRGFVVSTHHSAEAAIRARQDQEKKK